MFHRHKALIVTWMAVLVVNVSCGGKVSFKEVRIDGSSQLHIKKSDGSEFIAPKLPGQSGFAEAAVSPDQQSAGWLAEFQDTSSPSPIDPDALSLVIFRNGQIFRHFDGDPIIWDWKFERSGKQIAYSTGSRHGGANECVLMDIDSGRVIEKWSTSSSAKSRLWTEGLRR